MIGSIIIATSTINSSKKLHNNILKNLLRSPMLFFDITPIGRILNRFAKDIDVIDVLLPMALRTWVQLLISVRIL